MSQPQKNTFSQSTIKSFQSKKSFKHSVPVKSKILKKYEFPHKDKSRGPKSQRPSHLQKLMKNFLNMHPKRRGEKTLYDASVMASRGKSTDVVKSSKDILMKERGKGPAKIGLKVRLGGLRQDGNEAAAKDGQMRMKQTRFSLNDSKSSGQKAKDMRKILLHQLKPNKRGKAFHFTDKVQLDTRSEFLGQTVDSMVLGNPDQPVQLKPTPLKKKIKGKLRNGRKKAPSPKVQRKTKKATQKQKFLEFQKRKIEKKIRSFHSLEPSSISNMIQRKQDKSVQSSTKHEQAFQKTGAE